MATDEETSVLTVVMDLTSSTWGEREHKRQANDKLLAEKNKKKGTAGPANYEEAIQSLTAFLAAFSTLNRNNSVFVIGVTSQNAAVLYPRKKSLDEMISARANEIGTKVDLNHLHEDLRKGAAELIQREVLMITAAAAASSKQQKQQNICMSGTCVAAGMSLALCIINRYLLVNEGNQSFGNQSDDNSGVLSSILKNNKSTPSSSITGRQRKFLLPRIFVIQATEDRTKDYNSFMNCTFAAIKRKIIIDGCYLKSGRNDSSEFLEQACDRTGGVFLAPAGAAQADGALLEVMVTLFLCPPSVRSKMNLPIQHKVDFCARCFETGESVKVAHVCNQCLSIFKHVPETSCPTCGGSVSAKKSNKNVNDLQLGDDGDDRDYSVIAATAAKRQRL